MVAIAVGKLTTDQYNAAINGNGKIELGGGSVRDAKVTIEGAGVYESEKVRTRKLRLEHVGNAISTATVEEGTDIYNRGSGNITIGGKGTCFMKAGRVCVDQLCKSRYRIQQMNTSKHIRSGIVSLAIALTACTMPANSKSSTDGCGSSTHHWRRRPLDLHKPVCVSQVGQRPGSSLWKLRVHPWNRPKVYVPHRIGG
jgi:hypothetical protein